MNALDSPLEALAFNYLSYGFLTAVNSLWAWIAVVTAAVSLWKIRAQSTPPSIVSAQSSIDLAQSSFDSAQSSIDSASVKIEKKCLSIASNTTSFGVLERECNTKVKFTLHYDNEDAFDECDESGGDESDGGDLKSGWRWLSGDWERMRMGDLGWYTCQDLTVLNGNVVRLWDGSRRLRE